MKQLTTFLILSLLCLIINAEYIEDTDPDYCLDKRCGELHVGCNPPEGFDEKCGDDVELIDLTNYKEIIQSVHNEERNRIAAGADGLPPAIQMAFMRWSPELTKLAAITAKKCDLNAAEKCHNTRNFIRSGQNIGLTTFSEDFSTKTIEDLISKRIEKWIRRGTVKMNDVVNYQIDKNNGMYTSIIKDHNCHLGCAAVRFRNDKGNNFLMVCNYATTNIIGEPIYKMGKASATKCKLGNSEKYQYLCKEGEPYRNFE